MADASESPYLRLGGAVAVRELVNRFYDHMSELPEARAILGMHPENLASSREKLFMFLSGWLGGPQLYMERFGHPRLRARHMPFSIDSAAASAWMACMHKAMDECIADEQLKEHLRSAFQRLADHMRNAGEHERPEDPKR
jgi:hemoglobin